VQIVYTDRDVEDVTLLELLIIMSDSDNLSEWALQECLDAGTERAEHLLDIKLNGPIYYVVSDSSDDEDDA
jgi:hypothetical protein